MSASTDGLDVRVRNNIRESGDPTGRPIVFVHGFGCSQEMWRDVAPSFAAEHRVILLDQVGAGASDTAAYERRKYDSLHGYATDLLEILEQLDLSDAVVVAHSVSAMIAVLAAGRDSSRITALVLIGPSPRYIDEPGYTGGFTEKDIEALLDALDANYLGWSAAMGPVIAGNPDRPELGGELAESFCATDPDIARHFARVTFLSDNRRDLDRVSVPTLVMQCSADPIAPLPVGDYVHAHIPDSRLVVLEATGHLPHLSAPAEVVRELASFLR
ncbi:MAG: alpha/beta hydrolase [Naasia sp.]|nr:alpha/beta hydrolase [Naasia sp.]